MDFVHFLAWRAGTNSQYSTGERSPIKAEQPEPSLLLGTAWEIHHIYEDLNARILSSAWFSVDAKDFVNPPDFLKAQGFHKSAWFLAKAKIS
jgi:hypothetical protein